MIETKRVLSPEKCREMAEWITEFLKQGYGPTVREAAKAWEVSPQTASSYMAEMEEREYITFLRDIDGKRIPRQIKVLV